MRKPQAQEGLLALAEIAGACIVDKYTFAFAGTFPVADVDRAVDARLQRHAALGNAKAQRAAGGIRSLVATPL